MAAKLYREEFIVGGAVAFPIDMLRYDCCWPATEQDAQRITATLADPSFVGPTTVRLARYTTHNTMASVTAGRWRSLGWLVEPNSFIRRPLIER